MGEPSIKKNFAYKSALTISTYLMNFVTFPYVARVLGVEGIGLVSFVDNTVNYFLLFATMGVSYLGVREIASAKTNKVECDRVFSCVLGMNIMFTLLTLIVYFTCIYFFPALRQYEELFYIGGAKILFTAFLVEWYFTGVEKFRYITIRSLIIKLLYVIIVFIFVRTQEDYILYFALTVLVVVINAIINVLYIRKFVNLIKRELFSGRYIKQNFSLGFYFIMTSMYLTFNVMYLGLFSTNIEVGYYTTAFKLYSVILGFFTAFTSVMLPRMSSLLAEGKRDEFQVFINKSFEMMCTFSIPLVLCCIVMTPQIIYVLSGNGYEGAILPMRIIMPAVLFVGIAQVFAVQLLLPLKKDKILFLASILGAFVSLLINILVVPKMQSIGSAIVLLCAEIVVTLVYVVYALWNKLVDMISLKPIWRNFLYSLPSVAICCICSQCIDNKFYSVIVSLIVAICCWSFIQMAFHTYCGKRFFYIIRMLFPYKRIV